MIRSKGDNFYPYKYICTKKGCYRARSPLYGSDGDFVDGWMTDACGNIETKCETRGGILCIQWVKKKKVKKREQVDEIDSDLYLNY